MWSSSGSLAVALNETVQGWPGRGWQPPPLVTVTVGGWLAAGVGVGSGDGVGEAVGTGVGEGFATGGRGVVGRSSSQPASVRLTARAAIAIIWVRIPFIPPVGSGPARLQGGLHCPPAASR